jgi:hypothetical protein
MQKGNHLSGWASDGRHESANRRFSAETALVAYLGDVGALAAGHAVQEEDAVGVDRQAVVAVLELAAVAHNDRQRLRAPGGGGGGLREPGTSSASERARAHARSKAYLLVWIRKRPSKGSHDRMVATSLAVTVSVSHAGRCCTAGDDRERVSGDGGALLACW